MPNEYGQILLQQIEEQRQQRLRQRAEERGLPFPPEEPTAPSKNTSFGDATAPKTNVGASGVLSNNAHPPFSKDGDTLLISGKTNPNGAATGTAAQQQTIPQSADASSALQSLLTLAPLFTRQLPLGTTPLGVLPAPCVQSVVPAPLLGQQPLVLQPTAVVPPAFFSVNPQHVAQLSQSQQLNDLHHLHQAAPPVQGAGEEATVAKWSRQSNNEKTLRTSRETSEQPFGFAVGGPFTGGNAHQSQLEAKKQYQTALLKQMQEREAQREAEKSRRRKEDEEERRRLSSEIERERLEKEEEEAKHLSKSRQLAAANVAAAESTIKPLRSRQATRITLANDSSHGGHGGPVQHKSLQGGSEQAEGETIRLPADKPGQSVDLPKLQKESSVQSDMRAALDLDSFKAELRSQCEELRLLQSQQRQLLQHMQYYHLLHDPWNASRVQRWHQGPAGSPASQSALVEAMPGLVRMPITQRQLQKQCALVSSFLKDAGVPNAEDIARRLAERGLIHMGQDVPLPGAALWNRLAPVANEEAGAKMELPQACADETCEYLQSCPSKQIRGLSKSSCCCLHCSEKQAQEPKNHEEDINSVEDPEERPLPTLMRRQQQHVQLAAAASIQQERQQPQVERTSVKTSPVTSETNSSHNSRIMEAHGQQTAAEKRQSRPARGAHRVEVLEAPFERRWRLNELWACVTSGLPLPPPRTPAKSSENLEVDSMYYRSNSWSASECESELPCQTVILPAASDRHKASPVRRPYSPSTQSQRRQMQKTRWLPRSQMEYLDASISQTATSDEQATIEQDKQDLYLALLSRVMQGGTYEGIRVAQSKAVRPAWNLSALPISEHQKAPSQLSPIRVTTEEDYDSGSDLPDEGLSSPPDYMGIYRALSTNAAPKRLQQLHALEDKVRQQYERSHFPKDRCLRRLEAFSSQQRMQQGLKGAAALRAQERYKSRLSWEADTAQPLDEGSRAPSHITQVQVKAFGLRPFATPLEPVSGSAAPTKLPETSSGHRDNVSSAPAKSPMKHTPLNQILNRAASVTTSNRKRSRLSRVFGGLARSASKTRQ